MHIIWQIYILDMYSCTGTWQNETLLVLTEKSPDFASAFQIYMFDVPCLRVISPCTVARGTEGRVGSKRFWSHCCFSAKAKMLHPKLVYQNHPGGVECWNASASLYLLLFSRGVLVLFGASDSSLTLQTHLQINVSLLCSQFVLRDIIAGSSFTVFQGGGSPRCMGACSELTPWPIDIFIKSIGRVKTAEGKNRGSYLVFHGCLQWNTFIWFSSHCRVWLVMCGRCAGVVLQISVHDMWEWCL